MEGRDAKEYRDCCMTRRMVIKQRQTEKSDLPVETLLFLEQNQRII